MPKNSIVVVSEGYTFRIFSNRRIITESKDLSDEELVRIDRAYKLYKKREKHCGRRRKGIWKRCSNPECKMVLYINQSQVAQKKGSFCSHRCQREIFWAKKRNKDNFGEWFLTLETEEAVCWILDSIFYRDLERIKRLKLLLRASDEKTKIALREIFREIPGCGPAYPVANKIMESYIQSEEGKDIRIPIQKLVGILFYIPVRP